MVQVSAPPPFSLDSPRRSAVVRYSLTEFSDAWIIPEEPVPESAWHDRCLEIFKALLDEWVVSSGRNAAVFRDIAIRTSRENPRVGWNPDVCLVEPAPAEATDLESLRLWEHASPRLAFEAVSPNHPHKDYVIIPEKCAVAAVEELCVFDPLNGGSAAHGGPSLLQLWRRAPDGAFDRVHAGEAPARSAVLGAWLIPERASRTIRIADREDGTDPWLTAAERARDSERISVETARAALEREELARQHEAAARASAEAAIESAKISHEREAEALRRVAELEEELRRRR